MIKGALGRAGKFHNVVHSGIFISLFVKQSPGGGYDFLLGLILLSLHLSRLPFIFHYSTFFLPVGKKRRRTSFSTCAAGPGSENRRVPSRHSPCRTPGALPRPSRAGSPLRLANPRTIRAPIPGTARLPADKRPRTEPWSAPDSTSISAKAAAPPRKAQGPGS